MKWYNFDEFIRRGKSCMKKLLTFLCISMLSLTATKTTLASEVTIHDPSIQVIVEEGDSLLSKSMKNVDHYEDVYGRALSRPTSAFNLSRPYYFEVFASTHIFIQTTILQGIQEELTSTLMNTMVQKYSKKHLRFMFMNKEQIKKCSM